MGSKNSKKKAAAADVDVPDGDTISPLPPITPTAGMPGRRGRRQSVSAEVDRMDTKWELKVVPKSAEARARIETAVNSSILFTALTSLQKGRIYDAMEEFKVSAGDVVIEQGNDGDYFYVIGNGKFDVWKSENGEEPQKVFNYDEAGSFGELALMYNCPRAATVKATTDGTLFRVDRVTFRHLVVESTRHQRKLHEQFLKKVPLFGKLTEKERSQVADALVTMEFEDGETIIEIDTHGDKFYIVEEGVAVALQKPKKDGIEEAPNENENPPDDFGELVEVGSMSVGEYFGERALICHEKRAATVKARGHLKVAVMDFSAFERLLGDLQVIMKRRISEYQTADVIVRKSLQLTTEEKATEEPGSNGDAAKEEVAEVNGDGQQAGVEEMNRDAKAEEMDGDAKVEEMNGDAKAEEMDGDAEAEES